MAEMQVIVMRHGHAEPSNLAGDRERALTAKGRASAAAAFDRMRQNELRFDRVLVSTARRTLQTWECSGDQRDATVLPLDALYNASVETIVDLVEQHGSERCLVIAHNPGLSFYAQTPLAPAQFAVISANEAPHAASTAER